MKKTFLLFGLTFLLTANVFAQSQKAMLYSSDPQLEKNKRIVYDFWRTVLEGGHLELTSQYLTETYIQHNPNVPTGRQGFIDFFGKFAKAKPIADTVRQALISIVAEGNMVVTSYYEVHPDPKDPTKKYTTTSFDMFRIENGKIAEHWDADLKE